jgi:TRAP-type C4-dicarboxylate transport system substrate-binding protein
MNKGIWKSLSPENRKTIEQINREWIEKQGRLWDDLDREAKEVFINKGGTIVELSEEENARWTNLLRPILDEYVRNMKAKGLPGDEALKFCIDYLKTHQK